MEDQLQRSKRFRAEFVAKEEERRRAALRNADLANELWKRDFDARVEAGLIDAEKYKNYVRLIRQRSAAAAPQSSVPRDQEARRAVYEQSQARAERCKLPATGRVKPATPIPLDLRSVSPDQGPTVDSPVYVEDGKVKVRATDTKVEGTYPWGASGAFNGVTPVEKELSALFDTYIIPAEWFSPSGWALLYPMWNISGALRLRYHPWADLPNWKAEVELSAAMLAVEYVEGAVGQLHETSALVFKYSSSDTPYEVIDMEEEWPFSVNQFSGAVVVDPSTGITTTLDPGAGQQPQLFVRKEDLKNGQVAVWMRLYARCTAGGATSSFPEDANSALLDLAGTYGVETPKLIVDPWTGG